MITLLYIPVPSREEGLRLARKMVQEKQAACGNVLGPMTSVYEWEGTVSEEEEFLLVLKTTADAVAALRKSIEELHPYECPCIASLDADANPAFRAWVEEQTA